MKSKLWIVTLSSIALVAGCAGPHRGDFCDIARPLYFEHDATVNALAGDEEELLRGIVRHNELVELCE